MRGLLWIKASWNRKEVGRSWRTSTAASTPSCSISDLTSERLLSTFPRRCNWTPSLKVDYESANWNPLWARVKRKCTNRMMSQLLNLLPTQQSEETTSPSYENMLGHTPTYSVSSRNTNRDWKHSKATKCPTLVQDVLQRNPSAWGSILDYIYCF